jgi:hypothetical protein
MSSWKRERLMRIPSRNMLSLMMVGYALVVVLAYNWEPVLGTVLLVLGVGSGLAIILRNRPKSGPLSFSTDCQNCGAPLQSHAGLPERTCRNCGHVQSWTL